MLILANADLSVDLLDPITDRARLGPRFCWGGYIWQVRDAPAGGPLLAGPEWPKPDPTAWNGQGLPEAFRHRTRDGRPLTWSGTRGVALGAGELALNSVGEVEVVGPCVWSITPAGDRVVYQTRQAAAGFDYSLLRKIELTGRSVLSVSQLTNHGALPLTLEWFAHPFFALTDQVIQAEVPAGSRLPDNPGFTLAGRTLTQKRRFTDAKDGPLEHLQLPSGKNLSVQLQHPAVRTVDFETSFPPDECLVWGNRNTFSIEPYQTLALAPGQTRQWSLRYTFGTAR